jgi:AraC-like DNA-binding protein
MRQLHTEISVLENNLLHIELIEDPLLICRFHSQPEYHSHPEIELLYVIKGSGKRTVNGKTERFESGDMVFLGAHVPHVWHIDMSGDEAERADNKALLLYFNPHKFQDLFETIHEFKDISQLLGNGSRGITVHGETQRLIVSKLHLLLTATGFEKAHGVLQILHQLSISPDTEFITGEPSGKIFGQMSDPLIAVIQYIHKNLHKPIPLSQLSDMACMTETAFCRFFKGRMKKSFSIYLQEQRLNKASELLLSTNNPISEIGSLCGYNSFSHFCKVFKLQYKKSPFQFRQVLSLTH